MDKMYVLFLYTSHVRFCVCPCLIMVRSFVWISVIPHILPTYNFTGLSDAAIVDVLVVCYIENCARHHIRIDIVLYLYFYSRDAFELWKLSEKVQVRLEAATIG